MIRLLHFADTHIGMENYGRLNATTGLSSRIHDFSKRMGEVVTFAREHRVDLVIFAGDAFKNRQPNPTVQREFANHIHDLSQLCPVVLLVGNHDLPSNLDRASSIEIYETLSVHNVMVGREFAVYPIETAAGIVQIATAPYPIRSQLITADQSAGKSLKQGEDMMLGEMINKLRGLSRDVALSEAPRILVGHFSISEAKPSSERGLMLGRDMSVPLSEVADPIWDYVALGHIHKHQNLTEGREGAPPVVYSGSLECIDFGEEHDHKGFCYVEVERGKQTNWQFVPVASRRFVTVRVDVRGLISPMGAIYEEIDARNLIDTVVKVIYQATEDQVEQISEREIVAHLLGSCGANYVAAIEAQIDRAVRTRLGVNPEQLNDWELLEYYFKSKDIGRADIDELLEAAHQLLEGGEG